MDSRIDRAIQQESEIGARIRQIRIQRGLTQVELAIKAGVSRSSIKYLEFGKGSSLSTLVKIANALDLSQELGRVFQQSSSISPMSLLLAQQSEKNPGSI